MKRLVAEWTKLHAEIAVEELFQQRRSWTGRRNAQKRHTRFAFAPWMRPRCVMREGAIGSVERYPIGKAFWSTVAGVQSKTAGAEEPMADRCVPYNRAFVDGRVC